MDTRLACMELLKKKFSGEITQEELDTECAYMLLQFLNEFGFTPEPDKPQDVLDYISRRKANPDYKVDNKFWQFPYILQYLHECKKALALNYSSLHALTLIKNGLLKGDTVNLHRVEVVLASYPVGGKNE